MLGVTQLSGFGGQAGQLVDAILSVQSANLKSFIDPGNAACYPAHPTQTIANLAPAADDDFWLGFDATTGADPSFSGTPGAQTDEHWLVQNTNEQIRSKTAVPVYRDFTKTGSISTLALMAQFDAFAAIDLFHGSMGSISDAHGFNIYPRSSDNKIDLKFNGSTVASSNTVTTGVWIFIGVVYDEPGGASASFLDVDGTRTTFTGTTSTTNPTQPGRFFITRTGTNSVGPVAAWDTALTTAEMDYVREQMARRYS